MKQFFSISLLCTTLLAIAGQGSSKISHQPEKTTEKTKESKYISFISSSSESSEEPSSLEEPSPPKPFDGKKWGVVYLGDNTVYACDDSAVREWSFDGETKSREITFSSTYRPKPTSYSFNEGNIASFNDRSFKIIKPSREYATSRMEKKIQTVGVTNSGQSMVLAEDGTLVRFDETVRVTEDLQTIDMRETSRFFPFSNGGIAYLQGCACCEKLCILDFDPKEQLKQIVLREKLQNICGQKVADKYLLAAHDTPHVSSQANLVLYDIEQNSECFSFPTRSHPKQFSVSPSSEKLATAGKGHKRSTIRLFDIETGKQLYSGTSDGIFGECGLRLDENDQIYFVGDRPFPTSQIIDTREASKSE